MNYLIVEICLQLAPTLQSSKACEHEWAWAVWEDGHEKLSWEFNNYFGRWNVLPGNWRECGRTARAAGVAATHGNSGAVSIAAARRAAARAAGRPRSGAHQLHSWRRFDAAQWIQ